MYVSPRHNAGFSLVELSIVLVILGLLVGGILGGQSLIRAAELRKVTTEYEQWQIAINTFRGKYNALPGDFIMAERFWTAGENCGTATQAGVCNGNNNGSITPGESQQFWLHLAQAGLINGNFSGAYLGKSAGVDYPSSATAGGWNMLACVNGDAFSNTFTLAGPNSSGTQLSGNLTGTLTAEEIWGIDTKMDDGKPNSGVVQTWQISCGAESRDLEAEYDFQGTENCAISFMTRYNPSVSDWVGGGVNCGLAM